ncbi:MAG: hypothetical protein PVG93_05305 [Phycisphaerales bacterium]|jgi:hypothetical protein
MSTENLVTYFYDTNKEKLGDYPGVLHIPLYKGMKISIHPYDNEYEVVDWNFHFGHSDEKAGLRIFLKETSTRAAYLDFKI